MGIFRVGPDGLNLGQHHRNPELPRRSERGDGEKFLPEIVEGDKRVLIIGEAGAVLPGTHSPRSEVRGNLAAGGKGVARPHRAIGEIGEALGPVLQSRGLLLAGVDVIGDCVTEMNVTSPTCFQDL